MLAEMAKVLDVSGLPLAASLSKSHPASNNY